MTPMISVVIPVYNRIAELQRALDSLVGQTYRDFEVRVCDDGSTVDIGSAVDPYFQSLNIHYQRIENSGGPARPRNTAAGEAKGAWIALLDSDDWWDPNYLERMSQQMSDASDVIYCQLRVEHAPGAQSQGEQRKVVGDSSGEDILRDMVVRGNPLANSATIVRKTVFEGAGGFCEDRALSAMEDFDLWLRLAQSGARFKFVDEVLGNYWVGVDNISTIFSKQIDREVALYRRHKDLFPPTLRSLAQACFHDRLGGLYFRFGHYGDAISHLREARPLPGIRRSVRRWLKLLISHWKRRMAS